MYYGGPNFEVKYLVNNINLFSLEDTVAVRTTRDGGRNVGSWGIVSAKQPTSKGAGYLTVRHKVSQNGLLVDLGPGNPNDWITEGDVIAKAPLSLNINSPISGPFIDTTINGIQTNYYQPIDNFNNNRHQIFNYNSLDQTTPINKNPNLLLNNDFAGFNYAGLCFFNRIIDRPRGNGGVNSLGNRLQIMLTRQHIMICSHYPVTSAKTFFVTDGVNFYNRTIRRTINPSEYSIPPNSANLPTIGSGYMVPALYPTWYALKNPGKDILEEHPDLSLQDFAVFSDFSLQVIKNPVPLEATGIFALNKARFRNITELTQKPALIVQSSFHFAGIVPSASLRSSVYSTDSAFISGVSSTSYRENFTQFPLGTLNTDFLNGIDTGDSGSVFVFKYTKPDLSIGYILGGLTLSAGSSAAVTINSNGEYLGCETPSSFPTCSPLLTYSSEAFNTGFSAFDDASYKVIEIILKDKSWQITEPSRIIPNEPELNIQESDLIDTLPRVVEFNANLDDVVPISNFQFLSLSSGVNYFSNQQKQFSGISKKDILSKLGTDFTFGPENPLNPSVKESLLDFRWDDLANGIENFGYTLNVPVKYRLADTADEILDVTVNPNLTRQAFKYGGDLTKRTNLEEINKSFNTSGMVVYKTKK
jgi:hypothetical protein